MRTVCPSCVDPDRSPCLIPGEVKFGLRVKAEEDALHVFFFSPHTQ